MMTPNFKLCLRYLRHLTPFVGWAFFQGRCKLTIKSFFAFLVFISGFLVISYLAFYSPHLRKTIMGWSEASIEIDLSQNYFEPREKVERRGFLVDTPKCRIPNVDLWNPQIRRLIKPPKSFNCTEMSLMLTYVKVETVFINESALKTVGYTYDNIHCCYKTVERIQRLQNSSNPNADRSFRFSQECESMGRITKPKFSFIKVICKFRGDLRNPLIIYTNFHMVAMFPNDEKSDIGRIVKWWQDCLSDSNGNSTPLCSKFRQQGRPPNILLIGWDSTSRAQFHRFLLKTKDVLQNKLGAVEMLGYNKVGVNTFPNFVPLTTSYSEKELQKLCYFNRSTPFDKCPFVWKQFNDRNYLTGHVEDSPHLAIFNYLKTGFIQPPTDIYPRSLMRAAYKEFSLKSDKNGFFKNCMGYQRPEEVILNYLVDLANLSESRGIPYLLSTWLTDLTHDDLNNLQTADDLMAGTLERLDNAGLLENTVLLLISDHGYRFFKIRTTVTGWLEDNLPTFWIKLPPTLVQWKPSWLEALRYNSKTLTTPFDVFQVLQDILNLYWKPVSPGKKSEGDLRGISLFEKIPARSCPEAGIPSAFCACAPPTACNFNSTLIKLAANLSLSKLNSGVPSGCAHFEGAVVTACGVKIRKADQFKEKAMKTNTTTGNGTSAGARMEVILFLKTKPGNFLFQVTLRFDPVDGRFLEVVDYSRVNKHETSLACLKVPKNGVLELSCYCDTSAKTIF